MQAGRFDEAVAEIEHATRLEPGSMKAAGEAAVTYSRLRRREEAMRAFNRLIALAPDDHLTKVIKGQFYLRWKGVADTLAAAMERIPSDWDPGGMATYSRYTVILGPAPIRRRDRHARAIASELSPTGWCISQHR